MTDEQKEIEAGRLTEKEIEDLEFESHIAFAFFLLKMEGLGRSDLRIARWVLENIGANRKWNKYTRKSFENIDEVFFKVVRRELSDAE